MIMLPFVASADPVEIDGIYYNLITKANVAEVTKNPDYQKHYTGSITIPDSISWDGVSYTVVSIGDDAFRQSASDRNGLEAISLPQSITSIGYNAFRECVTLKSVNIKSLDSWCGISFANGDSNPVYYSHNIYLNGEEIRDLVIPDGISSIGNYTFRGCSGLSSIHIPNSVISIGDDAFLQCTGLVSVNIPDNVQTIGSQSFFDCSSMKSLTIGNGVLRIGGQAFFSCKELVSVIIPNSVFVIGANAFAGCDKLEKIEIGESVYEIQYGAFSNCPELKDVYCYRRSIPTTYEKVFYGSYIEYATLHVPGTAVNQYKEAEPWKNFKEIVILDMPKYTLKYIVDSEEYKSYQIEEGATITPEPAPTKEGYTFSGWSDIPETMPAHDVTVTGTFSINSYKLTYMIDDIVYKETMYEYGATINPEPQPEGDYATFEWKDLPQTMPAHDVVVYASYTSGIIEVLMTTQRNIRIYSPNGKKLDKLQKGLNIVVLDDGTMKKVVVK